LKKLVVLLTLSALLTACGNDEKLTEETADKTIVSEETAEIESVVESAATENDEEIAVEETESEAEEEELVEVAEESTEEDTSGALKGSLTSEEIKATIQDFIGFDDEVLDLEVEDGDIYLSLVMATDDTFTPEDLAVNRYSQLSDELLYYEGWNELTVEFLGIGTISMDSSEAELNDYGYYFSTLAIEEELSY
jgi:hypothetical protein